MIEAIEIILFILIIAGVILVIWTKNVIHAAYGLGMVLLLLAASFVLLQAELLAVTQILLYAGGVVIILVFGVMMTTRNRKGQPLTENKNVVVASVVSLAVLVGWLWLFSSIDYKKTSIETHNQIKKMGVSFFTDHLVAFELIAFILLVVLVGAAYLAKMSSDHGN